MAAAHDRLEVNADSTSFLACGHDAPELIIGNCSEASLEITAEDEDEKGKEEEVESKSDCSDMEITKRVDKTLLQNSATVSNRLVGNDFTAKNVCQSQLG